MTVTIRHGDCRELLPTLPDGSVHMCCTSPPYFGLRDYGHAGQIGLEATPDAFVAEMVDVFREVRRVLRDDGTLWLVLGDSYSRSPGKGQHKPGDAGKQNYIIERGNGRAANTGTTDLPDKNLLGIPWRVALALQADGWILRQDIIWSKPNPMPESVTDRCTKAHEYIFLMSKSQRYYYDADAIAEPANWQAKMPDGWDTGPGSHGTIHRNGRERGVNNGANGTTRNRRSVWEVTTQPFSEAHFATFPPALIEPCIKAGCPIGGTVLDPFAGAGTTGLVADRLQRNALLIELNSEYNAISERRIRDDAGLFAEIAP